MSIQDLVTIEDVRREIATIMSAFQEPRASEGAIMSYLGQNRLLGESTRVAWPEGPGTDVVIYGTTFDGAIKVRLPQTKAA